VTQYHDKQLAHPCVDMLACQAIDTCLRLMVGQASIDPGQGNLIRIDRSRSSTLFRGQASLRQSLDLVHRWRDKDQHND